MILPGKRHEDELKQEKNTMYIIFGTQKHFPLRTKCKIYA